MSVSIVLCRTYTVPVTWDPPTASHPRLRYPFAYVCIYSRLWTISLWTSVEDIYKTQTLLFWVIDFIQWVEPVMSHPRATLGLLTEAEVILAAGGIPKLCWVATIQLRRIYWNSSTGCWKEWGSYQVSDFSKLFVHTRPTVSFGRDNTNRWFFHVVSLPGEATYLTQNIFKTTLCRHTEQCCRSTEILTSQNVVAVTFTFVGLSKSQRIYSGITNSVANRCWYVDIGTSYLYARPSANTTSDVWRVVYLRHLSVGLGAVNSIAFGAGVSMLPSLAPGET